MKGLTLKQQIKLTQMDMAFRLSPLAVMMLLGFGCLFAVLFWSPQTKPFFLSILAAALVLAVIVVWRLRLWKSQSLIERAKAPHDFYSSLISISGGLLMGALPVLLYPTVKPDEQVLVAAGCSAMMATSLTIAVVPRLAFLFCAPFIAGGIVSMVLAGKPIDFISAVMLLFYGAFLWFLTKNMSNLVARHVEQGLSLHRERALTRMLLNDFDKTSMDWVWELDHDMVFIKCSDPTAARFIGKPISEFMAAVTHPQAIPAFQALLDGLKQGRGFRDHTMPVRVFEKDAWWLLSGQPLYDDDGLIIGYSGLGSNITEKKRAEDRLEFLALHDGLTELPNRARFEEAVERMIEGQGHNTPFAIICFNLDDFKPINDAFGHDTGDALLCEVAKRMRSIMPPSAVLARLAGDDFAILIALNELPVTNIEAFCLSIRDALNAPFQLGDIEAHIGVSLGVAIAPKDGLHSLIKHADLALAQAKRNGKNQLHFYDQSLDAVLEARMRLKADLRAALKNNELFLLLQPLVGAKSRKVEIFEALVRWNHPVHGLVSPADFIPLAEETGLIMPLGEWVLKEACRLAVQWPQSIGISVNLSPIQLRYSDVPRLVAEALEASGLPAQRLQLEMTESSLIEASDHTLGTLGRLRTMGVKLALDDFGTGFSSLSTLSIMPFHKVKIDRSFVMHLPDRGKHEAIIKAIVELSLALGLSITAEGVENEAQAQALERLGCTQFQGYYFSRPVTYDATEALIAKTSIQAAKAG